MELAARSSPWEHLVESVAMVRHTTGGRERVLDRQMEALLLQEGGGLYLPWSL